MNSVTDGSPRSQNPFSPAAVALAVGGVATYAVFIWQKHLIDPWFLPVTGTLAVVLYAVGLKLRRSVARVLIMVVLVLLAGMEWAFFLGTRAPAYTGPAMAGQPVPAFATVKADGTAFTQNELRGAQTNVLVFFRGRW